MALILLVLLGWMVYARIRIGLTETQPRRIVMPVGDRWIPAHDVNIHLREWGPKDGKPLLLVHGTGAWNGTWASNVEAIVAAGFRVVALDLPPFGFSTLPASGDYSRQAQARRILAVIEQMGAQPVTLLGHSFGGGPAAEAAMLDARRIARLVLVDAAIGLHSTSEPVCQVPWAAQALLGWRPMRTTLVAALGTEPAFSQFWLRQFVARKEVVTVERTAIYQQPFANQGFSAGMGDWAYQFVAGCESPRSMQPEGFRTLAIPVALVWGAQDSITPLSQAQELHSLLPQSRLTILAGVGHIPQIEDVALFNAEIVKLLQAP